MRSFFDFILGMALFCMIFYRKLIVKYYKETDFLYTALGDDISSSIAAFLFHGFAYRVNKYLRVKYSNVIFKNFAKPTFTSSDLLSQLKNCDNLRMCIRNSKIITISIGANNLLKGISTDFTDIDGRIVKNEIESFRNDWYEILYFIRNRICSKAAIYVMNLYNPYDSDDPNYSIAEYYINSINSIITSDFWIKSYNYKVADIHEYFKTNSGKKLTLFNSYVREPFPSYKGYKYIAEAFINIIN